MRSPPPIKTMTPTLISFLPLSLLTEVNRWVNCTQTACGNLMGHRRGHRGTIGQTSAYFIPYLGLYFGKMVCSSLIISYVRNRYVLTHIVSLLSF